MTDTLFKQVNYTASSLIDFIELGEIGLPDIQRPFVWKNTKVRDLFDSMYRGYPVGYLLFWQNAFDGDAKVIGTDDKQLPARLLIVDGQQRLTSLYAVIKGIPVLRENYSQEHIHIAFSPLENRFEVADAAIRKDPSFIPDVSVVWNKDIFKLVEQYISSVRATRELSAIDETQIKEGFTRLQGLKSFPFTALELAAKIDEEQVAEVFVRINSKGTPLNQADFILTLMSVFWDEGRKELETFCAASRKPSTGPPSPYNHFLKPDPDQLLRVSVGVGFKRARLRHVYSILRGKDLDTEEFSADHRNEQFDILKDAQQRVLNLTYWHDFFTAVRQAGYLGGRQITSNNNLIFAYILYLLGRTEYGVEEHILRRAVARYFFMCNLTGRYTGSPESDMEFDLARFRGVDDAHGFVSVLDRLCDSTLTPDFWSITLPNNLATSAAWSPSLFSYYAALILLDAKALFSRQKITDLLDPSVHGKKAAAERHHLFPKAYLNAEGITETRETNQIANFALMEWGDNVAVSKTPPHEYVPVLSPRFGPEELVQMHYWHALPDGWEEMDYAQFLEQRRDLMARVIADAFKKLSAPPAEAKTRAIELPEIVEAGEGVTVEFKSTLRINLHTKEPDKRMELSSLKTIAGFLNAKGGTLIIGVGDNGTAVGVDADGFKSEDHMHLHLVNLIRDRIGPQYMMYIHPRFDSYGAKRVLAVECTAARSPVVLKDGNTERFYVRTGAATTELSMSQAQSYIGQRFGSGASA